jgi:hypothetical protein
MNSNRTRAAWATAFAAIALTTTACGSEIPTAPAKLPLPQQSQSASPSQPAKTPACQGPRADWPDRFCPGKGRAEQTRARIDFRDRGGA